MQNRGAVYQTDHETFMTKTFRKEELPNRCCLIAPVRLRIVSDCGSGHATKSVAVSVSGMEGVPQNSQGTPRTDTLKPLEA